VILLDLASYDWKPIEKNKKREIAIAQREKPNEIASRKIKKNQVYFQHPNEKFKSVSLY